MFAGSRGTPPSSPTRFAWLALLLGLVAAAYHNSLDGVLVLDDITAVRENTSIRRLWPLTSWLLPPNDAGVGGRPLANLSFAVNYAVGGLDVRGYHLGNVVLHGIAALLLFGVVRRTLQRSVTAPRREAAPSLALAVAALWAVHPLTSAVVDYVSQRTEALMACCALFTLYAFIRGAEEQDDKVGRSGAGWFAAAAIGCALGMASKEVMVTIPLLVLLYDRTFLSDNWRSVGRRRGWAHAALAMTWALLATFMLTSNLGDRGVGFNQSVSPWTYLATESTAVVRYLRLAIWPEPLVFDYGWAFASSFGAVWPDALIMIAALIGTAALCVRHPRAGFLAFAFWVLLAPTSSFIPIAQQPIAESRMYLPLAVVVTALVLLAHATLRTRARLSVPFVLIAGLALTLRRNLDYRSGLTLWQDTVNKFPTNARAHGSLGAALLRAGQGPEGEAELRTALTLRPHAEAHANLAVRLLDIERPTEALEHLDAAIELDPTLASSHYNRGHALMQLNRRDEAATALENTLRLQPRHARAHSDLAMIYLEAGRAKLAIEHARSALRLEPTLAPAHHNLANALVALGQLDEAIGHYREALRIDPTFARAEHNLAVALLRAGDSAGAIEHFEAALRLKPDYVEARRNLEVVRGQAR